jgi:hypothetical protein
MGRNCKRASPALGLPHLMIWMSICPAFASQEGARASFRVQMRGKREIMNVSKILAGLALGACLFFASSAFASDHGNLQLFQKVNVNGAQLGPGQYKVEWSGTNNHAKVKILKGNDVLASAPGKIVPTEAQEDDGYTMKRTKSGKEDLTGVFFGGKKWTLELRQSASLNSAHSTTQSGE